MDDPQYTHFRDISELPQHILSELKRFFLDYKALEGKEAAIEAMRGHAEAEAVIDAAVTSYADQASRLRSGAGMKPR